MLGTGGLSSQTLKLLNTLESKLPDFYLAEGTALAMYYEHRVSFFEYHYALVGPFSKYRSLNVASINDLAAMKLSAIAARAEKKDYFDLAEIVKRETVETVLRAFVAKYGRDVDLYHIIRAVTFFKDVENSPDPLEAVLTWKEVKDCLEAKSKELLDAAKILVRHDPD